MLVDHSPPQRLATLLAHASPASLALYTRTYRRVSDQNAWKRVELVVSGVQ